MLILNKLDCVREVLLICMLIYFSQGALMPQGTVFSQSLILTIFIISIYYCFKVILLEKGNSVFIWAWFSLLTLSVLGYFFTLDLNNSIYFSQIKAILFGFLPLFPFYYLAKRGKLNEKHLLRFFIVMLFIAILNFNHSRNLILSTRISDGTDVVNNLAYQFVLLIPYVFLFRRYLFSIFIFGILFIFIIQGAKRGALIVGVIGALYFIYYRLKNIEAKYKISGYIMTVLGIICLIFFTYRYFLDNEFLITRLSKIEEGGSGRDIIFSNLINAWYNSNSISNLIFGHGFSSTLKLSGTGNFAHNDWLELLTNFGLVGVILYLFVFIGLLEIAYQKSFDNRDKVILLTIISMWFITSQFSMVFNSQYTIISSLLIAFLVGRNEFKKKFDSF